MLTTSITAANRQLHLLLARAQLYRCVLAVICHHERPSPAPPVGSVEHCNQDTGASSGDFLLITHSREALLSTTRTLLRHRVGSTISIEPSPFSTFGASPDLLTHYLSLQPAPLTLRQLMAQGGKPGQALTPEQLLLSAQHTHRELPIRLARSRWLSCSSLHRRQQPLHLEDSQAVCIQLRDAGQVRPDSDAGGQPTLYRRHRRDLVSAHAQNIPTLARGFQESRKYMDARQISAFLDAAIHSRIAIRMIAEQHLALSATSNALPHLKTDTSNKVSSSSHEDHDQDHDHLHHLDPDLPAEGTSNQGHHEYGSPTAVGIIETQLSPARMTRMCAAFVRDLCEGTLGARPRSHPRGDLDVTYTGVPVHLEYVMTELLKNSYRATTENFFKSNKAGRMPPVIVTIAQSPNHVSLRIRDQGAGISPSNLPHVFSYAFTTAGSAELEDAEETGGGPYAMQAVGGTGGDALAEMGKMGLASGLGTLAGLGYGLPMARIYAEYWKNGSALDLVSLYGPTGAIRL